jgi:hypothetical protein
VEAVREAKARKSLGCAFTKRVLLPDVQANLTFRLFVNFRQGRREQQGRQRYVHLLLARSPVVQAIMPISHRMLDCNTQAKAAEAAREAKVGVARAAKVEAARAEKVRIFIHHSFASVQTTGSHLVAFRQGRRKPQALKRDA